MKFVFCENRDKKIDSGQIRPESSRHTPSAAQSNVSPLDDFYTFQKVYTYTCQLVMAVILIYFHYIIILLYFDKVTVNDEHNKLPKSVVLHQSKNFP